MKKTAYLALAALAGLVVTIACRSDAASPASDKAAGKPAVTAAMLEKGRGIYLSTCAPCHGNEGKGDGPASRIYKPPPRDHTDTAYMSKITDEDIGKTIQMGGALKGMPLMPSHPAIRGEDLTSLVAFVRSLSQPSR